MNVVKIPSCFILIMTGQLWVGVLLCLELGGAVRAGFKPQKKKFSGWLRVVHGVGVDSGEEPVVLMDSRRF